MCLEHSWRPLLISTTPLLVAGVSSRPALNAVHRADPDTPAVHALPNVVVGIATNLEERVQLERDISVAPSKSFCRALTAANATRFESHLPTPETAMPSGRTVMHSEVLSMLDHNSGPRCQICQALLENQENHDTP